MEQQMSSLLRKPIKAHQGTIVEGKIVYEGEDTSSGNIVPTESAPVATPATSITPSAVSTPALTPAPTPTPPPAPTTQQPAPQPVQQPAPQLAPSPPPQPVAQPVETPDQAEQVASTFVPENVKKNAEYIKSNISTPRTLDRSKLPDAKLISCKLNGTLATKFASGSNALLPSDTEPKRNLNLTRKLSTSLPTCIKPDIARPAPIVARAALTARAAVLILPKPLLDCSTALLVLSLATISILTFFVIYLLDLAFIRATFD